MCTYTYYPASQVVLLLRRLGMTSPRLHSCVEWCGASCNVLQCVLQHVAVSEGCGDALYTILSRLWHIYAVITLVM